MNKLFNRIRKNGDTTVMTLLLSLYGFALVAQGVIGIEII